MPTSEETQQHKQPEKRPYAQRVGGKKLLDRESIPAGKARVYVLDHHNNNGIGILVKFPNDGVQHPTPAEKEIITRYVSKQPDEKYDPGYKWEAPEKGVKEKVWHRLIRHPGQSLEDVNPKQAMAIRFNNEDRANAIAADLTEHYASMGHAEQERQRKVAGSELTFP